METALGKVKNVTKDLTGAMKEQIIKVQKSVNSNKSIQEFITKNQNTLTQIKEAGCALAIQTAAAFIECPHCSSSKGYENFQCKNCGKNPATKIIVNTVMNKVSSVVFDVIETSIKTEQLSIENKTSEKVPTKVFYKSPITQTTMQTVKKAPTQTAIKNTRSTTPQKLSQQKTGKAPMHHYAAADLASVVAGKVVENLGGGQVTKNIVKATVGLSSYAAIGSAAGGSEGATVSGGVYVGNKIISNILS